MEIAAEIKESFAPEVPLTLHWDGKLMPDLTGRKLVDRLPIVVSGEGSEKILSVPKLPDEKAENTAAVINDVLTDWRLKNRICALSFDTTVVNTGAKSGVCVRMERCLGKQLIYLPCRHHIHEILLGAVFSFLMPDRSRGHDITLFVNFRETWPQIDQTKYRTVLQEPAAADRVEPWRHIVLTCSKPSSVSTTKG